MRDYAREDAGAQVVMASCVDERFPPENMLDGKDGTFWLTTGLYPQEFVLKLDGVVQVNKITTLSLNGGGTGWWGGACSFLNGGAGDMLAGWRCSSLSRGFVQAHGARGGGPCYGPCACPSWGCSHSVLTRVLDFVRAVPGGLGFGARRGGGGRGAFWLHHAVKKLSLERCDQDRPESFERVFEIGKEGGTVLAVGPPAGVAVGREGAAETWSAVYRCRLHRPMTRPAGPQSICCAWPA